MIDNRMPRPLTEKEIEMINRIIGTIEKGTGKNVRKITINPDYNNTDEIYGFVIATMQFAQ